MNRKNDRIRQLVLALLTVCSALTVLVIYESTHEPVQAEATAYFLAKSLTDTGAVNRVAAIYLNYRIFDSLLETLMLLVSVLAVIQVSWRKRHE